MSSITNPTMTHEQFQELIAAAPEGSTNQHKVITLKGNRATDALKFQLYRGAAVGLTAIAIYGLGVQAGQQDSVSKALKGSPAAAATTVAPGK